MLKIFIIFLYSLPIAFFLYLVLTYFKTRVPYVTTSKKYFPVIFENMKITPETVIYDLGCGAGSFLFAAEKLKPKKLVGFELLALHAWWGRLKAKILKSKVKIYRRDFFKANLSEADIIYLFLVKSIVLKVWEKIRKEGKRGALIVTLSDEIPDVKYLKKFKTEPKDKNSSECFVYQI
jgi:hypothetical protein